MQRLRLISGIVALVAMLAFSLSTAAATTVVVTPTMPQGWGQADTRPGGSVSIVADPTAPGGSAALQLSTDGTNAAKAQYIHGADTPLAQVTTLSYFTRQVAGQAGIAAPSYQLLVDLNGAGAGGFTTFVYEPYENGTVVANTWQQWDVSGGQFWSSRSFTEGTCSVQAGAGGTYFYTLSGLQAACPNAVVIGFGVNVGSYNPSYLVEADLVNFNGTVYDFELFMVPTSKDQCKKGGWENLTDASGQPFKNQGDCVSYVATGGKNR